MKTERKRREISEKGKLGGKIYYFATSTFTSKRRETAVSVTKRGWIYLIHCSTLSQTQLQAANSLAVIFSRFLCLSARTRLTSGATVTDV
jgi:hypothetical protein